MSKTPKTVRCMDCHRPIKGTTLRACGWCKLRRRRRLRRHNRRWFPWA